MTKRTNHLYRLNVITPDEYDLNTVYESATKKKLLEELKRLDQGAYYAYMKGALHSPDSGNWYFLERIY